MNPVQLKKRLIPENVAKYKNYDCKFYEKCLDTAEAADWSQFSCRECSSYEPSELPPELIELLLDE